MHNNARDLEKELQWFAQVLDMRFRLYFKQESNYDDIFGIAPPRFKGASSAYGQFVRQHQLSFEERITLIISLVPHLRPRLLDPFFTRNKQYNRKFTEFGGIQSGQQELFLPTGETLAFILSEQNLERRFFLYHLFNDEHLFNKQDVLRIVPPADATAPYLSGVLTISPEYLDYFTLGTYRKPQFSMQFPARHIRTTLEWDDLILEKRTLKQVEEIITWSKHHNTVMKDWDLGKKLRPGYRALFYGPPGAGKTMTASLLGKQTGKEVYKIDLSMVVSKYIGETEKNLSNIFKQAENKDWILFFDEADALFGKRTEIKDAHDRYANQEVSYLLQRVEDYNGIVILASNKKQNMDEAFIRRFEAIIYFAVPQPELRYQLWKKGFSEATEIAGDVDLKAIADTYEITGATIMNVVSYSSLMAASHNDNIITTRDILAGIQKEYQKEGKTLPA